MLNVFLQIRLIFFPWMEGNDVYSSKRAPVNSLLSLLLCLHSIFGRGLGIYDVQSAAGT